MYNVPQQNLSARDTQDFDHSGHSRRAVAVASLFLDPTTTGTGADLVLAPGAPATVDRFGSLVWYGYTLPLLAVLKHPINFTLTLPVTITVTRTRTIYSVGLNKKLFGIK